MRKQAEWVSQTDRRAAAGAATMVIAARNAAATIERAVRSALEQGDHPILLIDDCSDDDTALRAQSIGGRRLRVVRLAEHGPLGLTRQLGLMAIETPFGVWLDSDDECLPGRVSRLLRALDETGADIAADAADIVDDHKPGPHPRPLRMPSFLRRDPWLVRQFERNYLPAPGAIAFRTDRLRMLGYDTALHGAEDMDLLLRASVAGFRVALVEETGYRIHVRSTSQSRQLANQRAMYRQALLKHSYQSVERLFTRAGYDSRTTAWALVSMAAYREEFDEAIARLDQLGSLPSDSPTRADRDDASPWPETWRLAFWRGTLLLQMGDPVAASGHLAEAQAVRPSPEGANNLGVAQLQLGNSEGADRLFRKALSRMPHYRDAALNLRRSGRAPCVTSHPFRTLANRTDYPPLHDLAVNMQVTAR